MHIFARTRYPPYAYYYRTYNSHNQWTPWQTMQVDISSYNIVDSFGKVIGSGAYLIPLMWQGRLFVAFPQFTKVQVPNKLPPDETFQSLGSRATTKAAPDQFWQITLCWSEYRGGSWTQKQLSTGVLYANQFDTAATPPYNLDQILSQFVFVPHFASDLSVSIDVSFQPAPPAISIITIGRFDLINGSFVV